MPVDFHYIDDKIKILHYQFKGNWTWDELWSTVDNAREVTTTAPRVNIIADFRETGVISNDALTHLRKLVTSRPRNRGIVVIVGSNLIVRTIINMGKPLFPRSLRFDIVDTIDEAMDIIYAENEARH